MSPQVTGHDGRLRVAVLFGGQSPEHEVSLQSAASILQAIDADRFAVLPVGIRRDGGWIAGPGVLTALREEAARGPGAAAAVASAVAAVSPGTGDRATQSVVLDPHCRGLRPLDSAASVPSSVDVVFPVVHGPYGEDGTLQGLLEIAGIPYVGAGVLASALAMDKVRTKEILSHRGLPVVEWQTLASPVRTDEQLAALFNGSPPWPLFVKPARGGSSVGVTKVHEAPGLAPAVEAARRYDELILVERAVPKAREIEVSVLGNLDPQASVPGEVVPSDEFYSYEDKYVWGRARLVIPAALPPALGESVRQLAVAAFRALGAEGMARVDFLLDGDSGELYVSELNTIPGFTPISMYPKLWEASGLAYPDLITRLIELALERDARVARFRR